MQTRLETLKAFVKRVCGDKLSYNTIGEAEEAAKETSKHFHQRFHGYWCQLCGKFHVGHRKRYNRKREDKFNHLSGEKYSHTGDYTRTGSYGC